jgi:predicted dinucleotide-binding enzyme
MRIGIIGSGNIGGTVGPLWTRAGHEVLYSSRHPERLSSLVEQSGGRARAGSVLDAARFGDVILLAVPYGALPELSRDLASELRGKTLLDAGNLYPARDGAVAQEVLDSGRGAGLATAGYFPESKVVRAFNTVHFRTMAREAGREGDRIGIPLAADDPAALELAASLVRDAGFDPVKVGGLATAVRFDVGTPVYNTGMSGPELRRVLEVGG